MYEVGQRVRIRERTWVVLEDRADSMSGDHVVRVRGVDTLSGGIERTFVYRPVSGPVDEAESAALERITSLPAPELRWSPGTPPSQSVFCSDAVVHSLAKHALKRAPLRTR